MKRSLFSLFVVGAWLFSASAATACSCAVNRSPLEELDAADLVFVGEVTRMVSTSERGWDEFEVHFQVLRIWKGTDSVTVNVRTPVSSAACGYAFQAGDQYLVYAYRNQTDGIIGTNLCTRNSVLSGAEKDLTELGPGTVVGIETESPRTFALRQNYPNPFAAKTDIAYELTSPAFVTVSVFDVFGRHVRTLLKRRQGVGSHTITFDSGRLPSGVYLYELAVDARYDRKRMILAR